MKTITLNKDCGETLQDLYNDKEQDLGFLCNDYEEAQILEDLLGVKPDKIVFTTYDDDYESIANIEELISFSFRDEIQNGNYTWYKCKEVEFVFCREDGGGCTLFIRQEDISKIEEIL